MSCEALAGLDTVKRNIGIRIGSVLRGRTRQERDMKACDDDGVDCRNVNSCTKPIVRSGWRDAVSLAVGRRDRTLGVQEEFSNMKKARAFKWYNGRLVDVLHRDWTSTHCV